MLLSKGQKICIYVGLVFLIMPYSIYLYSRVTGLLPAESEWWAQGINHGPWRWKWQMFLILPSIYVLIIGAFGLFIIGVIKSIYIKSKQYFLVNLTLAIVYFCMFYLQSKTLFWTVD